MHVIWKDLVMNYLLLIIHQSYQWRDDGYGTAGPVYHRKKECECLAPAAGSNQHTIDFLCNVLQYLQLLLFWSTVENFSTKANGF